MSLYDWDSMPSDKDFRTKLTMTSRTSCFNTRSLKMIVSHGDSKTLSERSIKLIELGATVIPFWLVKIPKSGLTASQDIAASNQRDT